MTLIHRGLDQNHLGAGLNLYLWADDGDLAVRFVIPHFVFVEAFNVQPPDKATDRFPEVLATVQEACKWAYEREKRNLAMDGSAADVVVTLNDFLKARNWLGIGVQIHD